MLCPAHFLVCLRGIKGKANFLNHIHEMKIIIETCNLCSGPEEAPTEQYCTAHRDCGLCGLRAADYVYKHVDFPWVECQPCGIRICPDCYPTWSRCPRCETVINEPCLSCGDIDKPNYTCLECVVISCKRCFRGCKCSENKPVIITDQ